MGKDATLNPVSVRVILLSAEYNCSFTFTSFCALRSQWFVVGFVRFVLIIRFVFRQLLAVWAFYGFLVVRLFYTGIVKIVSGFGASGLKTLSFPGTSDAEIRHRGRAMVGDYSSGGGAVKRYRRKGSKPKMRQKWDIQP